MITFLATLIGYIILGAIALAVLILICMGLWGCILEPLYRWYFKNQVLNIRYKRKEYSDNQFSETFGVFLSGFESDYRCTYRKRTPNDKHVIFRPL